MAEREEALVRVAEAITDDLPVAWDTEKAAHPGLSESLEVLRQLDAMARAHSTSVDQTVDLMPADESSLRSWGHLRIVEKIGQGSFGEVYRAYDPVLRVDVALKLLRQPAASDPEAVEEFLDEARRLARVRHPHVLVVHGADRHDGRAGMWTEMLEGQTVEQMLERQGPLSPREAAAIGLDLCGALAAIHSAGVVHRDVKTENVMRAAGGRVVLMDLGCGGEMRTGAVNESVHIRGTPVAMAPEQFLGRTAGPPTDLFGLGVLLYRLVTHRYPIEAATFDEIRRGWTAGKSVGLRDRRPDLPAEFVRVVEKAIDPDPDRRYQTAGEMERALAEAAGVTVSGSAAKRPAPHSAPRSGRFPRAGRALAVAVVLVAAGWLGIRALMPKPAVDSARITRGEGPSATTPLTLRANLFRLREQAQERLQPGATIGPGDGLFLEVEGSDDCYVYVLNEDLQGRIFVLFPAPGLDTRNPLPRDLLHRLPGNREGKVVNWQVTSAGGEERVVVVASRTALDSLERQIMALPHPQAGAPIAYGELDPGARGDLYRAIGGLAEGSATPAPAPPGRLDEMVARVGTTRRPDLAVWQIQLANPGR